ncbi:MAG: hypothetical protein EP343_08420 [Deltaproteobacteria bacterium]|nr:MAG: hypothetical protein EP343_08420 [Deltaproteobacteria bacterium]
MKRWYAQLGLFVTLVTLTTALVACGGATEPTNNNDNTSTPQKLSLSLEFSPKQPLPNLPAQLVLQIKDEAGNVMTASNLKLNAKRDSESMDIPVTPKDNGFMGQNIVIPSEGEWTFTATVDVAGQSYTLPTTLKALCDNGGAEGAGCCEDSQCGDGLSCVYGSCQTALAAGGSACYQGNDCQSQVCENNACLAGSCTDGQKNGRETDVDCGGACGACDINKACVVDKDCGSGSCQKDVCAPPPGSLLGTGDGSPESVKWTVITDKGMSDPTGLAFHPKKPGELWILNRVTDSFTIVFSTGTSEQTQGTYFDRSQHFMEEVVALAMGDSGTMATCGDSTNTYGGIQQANFFMGPALWPDDVNKFVRAGSSIHVTHLDMLHSTPRCMGIAAVTKNQFYAFNGMLGTIDWYDFREPHVPGGDDHSDGVKRRFYSAKLNYVKGVPSNLVYDAANRAVFIAHTGGGEILRMDVSKANQDRQLFGRNDYVFGGDGVLYAMSGDTTDVVVPFPGPLRAPSGLVLHNDTLYVSDYKTGKLHAFDLDGKELRSLDSGLGDGALSGIAVNPQDNKLYLVDRKQNRILRIDPKE